MSSSGLKVDARHDGKSRRRRRGDESQRAKRTGLKQREIIAIRYLPT